MEDTPQRRKLGEGENYEAHIVIKPVLMACKPHVIPLTFSKKFPSRFLRNILYCRFIHTYRAVHGIRQDRERQMKREQAERELLLRKEQVERERRHRDAQRCVDQQIAD